MSIITVTGTPVERYKVKGHSVFVKREDLSCPDPGPPFAKVRGLYPTLVRLKKEGITTVGYVETSISMAGWGVAWMAKELGLKSVIFCPRYKDGKTRGELEKHQVYWERFGSEIIDQKAGRASVNFHFAKKILAADYPNSVLLPLGLRFPETVQAVAGELKTVPREYLTGTVVLCIGSGMMAAGLLKGLKDGELFPHVIGVQCYEGDLKRKVKRILGFAGLSDKPDFFDLRPPTFTVVDPQHTYTHKVEMDCPFACNPYYDLKAWEWLVDNVERLAEPILFWNIGS